MIDPYAPPTTQTADAADKLDQLRRPIFWWGISSIFALSLTAIFAALAAAAFANLYASFDARLALPTQMVLKGYPLLWILPASAAAMITDAMRRTAITADYRRRMIRIFVASLILAAVLAGTVIVALYFPMYAMNHRI